MSVEFDSSGPQASVATVTDRVRKLEIGAPVAAAYFLGDKAAFVGAEEAVTFASDDGTISKVEVVQRRHPLLDVGRQAHRAWRR